MTELAPASSAPIPEKGSLVRTVRRWPGGVERAEVGSVVIRDGRTLAEVCGALYAPHELEVIRRPLPTPAP